ncbi:MAG TPA: NCS2 family permease [Candidatus Limnocylindrales bacterium]|nr:NCS2 family permease [Candidatus Limnocylindrales bacterium]
MSAAVDAAERPGGGGMIGEYFKFAERGTNLLTEARGGLTTFMVMVYIVFVNASILGAGFKLDPVGMTAVSAGTALVAGIMTIAMGVVANYPFALAAGLGINAIVAFALPGRGLTPAGAMGVIVLEGLVVTLLVVAGFREAVMNAVPLALKRAIGAGIGLFILFIGFANGGLIQSNTPATLVTYSLPTQPSQFVFLFGLALTVVLWALRIKAALVISILVTTVVALIAGVATVPDSLTLTPSFSTLGSFDLGNVFSALPLLTALLVIFAIMLTDFFDTMGTATGVAAEAGLAAKDGSVPGIGRVLIVDSLAAMVGGLAGVSSNTTYIESAAGVAEGAKTGFASVVTGVLFLVAILLAPLAGIIPGVATAPALVLVGYLMFTQVREINVSDLEDGFPALLAIILMPLTYDITVGIGAGFISWVLIKVVRGKMSEVHPLMWVVSIGFLIFFGQSWIETLLPK